MYILPDSTLYILRNVPLDTTYEHTLWFNKGTEEEKENGKIAQANYFSSLAKYRLEYERGNALTYIRVNRGTIKVPYKADDLYDCNYIMFRNTSFGAKWFYAFIRSIEYVNNTTAEITFELDVMQTWHFDYGIDDCFVEREHSVDDIYGSNTLPESVDIGDYISTGNFGTGKFTDWRIVVVRACGDGLLSPIVNVVAKGGFYNGTYQQVEFDQFEPNEDSLDDIRGFLNSVAIWNNQDSVLGMYLIPAGFLSAPTRDFNASLSSGVKDRAFEVASKPEIIEGYGVPKNKKLLTYPYCYLECTNFEGDTKEYKYEYFINPSFGSIGNPTFALFTDTNIKPTVMIAPVNYMAYWEAEPYQPNLQEGICITNFPNCTYLSSDAMAKFVQASIGIALGSIATTTTSVRTKTGSKTHRGTTTRKNKKGEAVGTTRKTYTQRWGDVTTNEQIQDKDIQSVVADNLYTGISSSGINSVIGTGNIIHSANNGMDFGFRKLHIRPEYARIIDDYFSCFGYTTNRVKSPNCSSRPHWNYVKTANCTITGSVPCDDMAAICSIYDSGITFWKNGAEVGNYSLDNSPS